MFTCDHKRSTEKWRCCKQNCLGVCLHVGVRAGVISCVQCRFLNVRSCVFCSCLLQSSMESPNLEFEYGDTDTLPAELSGKTDK